MFNSNPPDYPNPQNVSGYSQDINNHDHANTFGSSSTNQVMSHESHTDSRIPVDMSRYARSPNHGHPSYISNSNNSSHQNPNHNHNQNAFQTRNLNRNGLGSEFYANMDYPTNPLLGPISAPATTEFADDYFLFVGIDSQDLEFPDGGSFQRVHQLQTLQTLQNLQQQQQQQSQNQQLQHTHQQFQVESIESHSHVPTNNRMNHNQEDPQQQPFSNMYTSHKLGRSNSSHGSNRLSRRRTFSAQRPATKSNLSMTYTGYVKSDQAIESPEPGDNSRESGYDSNIGNSGASNLSSHKKSRNPGFRIKLDDLGPKLKKVMSPNPSSAGNFNSVFVSPGVGHKTENVLHTPLQAPEFQSPTGHSHQNSQDMYLTAEGGVKIDYQQETVTPLMFPPQTDNRDYFGEMSGDRHRRDSLLYNMQGGQFIGKSIDAINSGPIKGAIDNNFGNFISVNDLQYSNSKRSYDQYNVMEQAFFDENLNDQKIEAHFTPVEYGGHITPPQPQNGTDHFTQQPQKQSHEELNDENRVRMTNSQQNFLASPYEDSRLQNEQHFEGSQSQQQYGQQYQQPQNGSQFMDNGHGQSQSPHNHQQVFNQQQNQQPSQYQPQNQQVHLQIQPLAQSQVHYLQQQPQQQQQQQQQQPQQHRMTSTQFSYIYEPNSATTIDALNSYDDSEEKETTSPAKQPMHHQGSFQIETKLKSSQDVLPLQDKSDGSNETSLELKSSKKKLMKGTVCSICDRFISRDYSRHMRIHNEAGRFKCVFPPGYCNHKSRKFNRPYDFKKHLLNMHFRFDEVAAKLAPNLTEKLNAGGHCTACGDRFVASEWLDNHILSKDEATKCYKLQELEQVQANDWT